MKFKLNTLLKIRMIVGSFVFVGILYMGILFLVYVYAVYLRISVSTEQIIFKYYILFIIGPSGISLSIVGIIGLLKFFQDIVFERVNTVKGKVSKVWIPPEFKKDKTTLKTKVQGGFSYDYSLRSGYVIVQNKKYWFFPNELKKLKRGDRISITKTKFTDVVVNLKKG